MESTVLSDSVDESLTSRRPCDSDSLSSGASSGGERGDFCVIPSSPCGKTMAVSGSLSSTGGESTADRSLRLSGMHWSSVVSESVL